MVEEKPEIASSEKAPETRIFTMPERFRVKKIKKGLSTTTLFILVVGVLFILVLGISTWYFTQPLRVAKKVVPPQEKPTTSLPQPSVQEEIPRSAAPSQPMPEEIETTTTEATTTEATTTPTTTEILPSEEGLVIQKGPDTDRDGLTEKEENLFTTSPTNPDSDQDGYLDGHEVYHLYNPAGTAPQRLEETNLVKRFSQENLPFTFLIPSGWQTNFDEANKKIVISTQDTAFFTIQILSNPKNLPLLEWAKEENLQIPLENFESRLTKRGLEGRISEEERKAFISGEGEIYVLTYELGEEKTIDYFRIFEMVFNSFGLRK